MKFEAESACGVSMSLPLRVNRAAGIATKAVALANSTMTAQARILLAILSSAQLFCRCLLLQKQGRCNAAAD